MYIKINYYIFACLASHDSCVICVAFHVWTRLVGGDDDGWPMVEFVLFWDIFFCFCVFVFNNSSLELKNKHETKIIETFLHLKYYRINIVLCLRTARYINKIFKKNNYNNIAGKTIEILVSLSWVIN